MMRILTFYLALPCLCVRRHIDSGHHFWRYHLAVFDSAWWIHPVEQDGTKSFSVSLMA